jgi:hypothetical protein
VQDSAVSRNRDTRGRKLANRLADKLKQLPCCPVDSSQGSCFFLGAWNWRVCTRVVYFREPHVRVRGTVGLGLW